MENNNSAAAVQDLNEILRVRREKLDELQFNGKVTVHTPFSEEISSVACENGTWQIKFPKETSYAILELIP